MREHEEQLQADDLTRLRIQELRDVVEDPNRQFAESCRLPIGVDTAIDQALLNEQLRSRLKWTEAAGNVQTKLLAGADTQAVLKMIARKARALAEADEAFIAQPRDYDHSPGSVTELVVTVAEGGSSHELLGAEVTVDTNWDANTRGPTIVAQLCAGDTVSGVLVVRRNTGHRPFTDELRALVCTFADQTAIAVSLGLAIHRTHELEVLADRERLARDLHNQVIQRIFAASTSLHGIAQRVTSPDIRRRLAESINELQVIIDATRRTIFEIQSDADEPTRIRQRIHEVVDEQVSNASVKINVRLSGPLAVVKPVLADDIVAVVQEGVSNALRHAAAGTITVSVSVSDDIVVDVIDDGVGLANESPLRGLATLRERARELGGDMTLSPDNGRGLKLRWTAPLTE